jgi:hypothetical protein
MPLRNLLKRRDDSPSRDPAPHPPNAPAAGAAAPQFTIIRTTTDTQEQIFPPQFAGDADRAPPRDPFRRPGSSSSPSPREQRRYSQHQQHMQQQAGAVYVGGPPPTSSEEQRPAHRSLTERLRDARRSRSRSVTSQQSASSRPGSSPAGQKSGSSPKRGAQPPAEGELPPAAAHGEDDQAAWERRATRLAHEAPGGGGSRPVTPVGGRPRAVSDSSSDVGFASVERVGEGGLIQRRIGFRLRSSCTRQAVRVPFQP